MSFVPAGCERNFTDDFDFGGDDFIYSQPKPLLTTPNKIHLGDDIQKEQSSDKLAQSWPTKQSQIHMSSNQHSTVEEEMRLAITRGTVEKVKDLLDNGFNSNKILRGGWTALMYACENCSLDIIGLLLERGANPNAHKDMFSCLMALCCTKTCDEEQLTACVELLINEGAKVNGHDRHRMTSLMYACQTGHTSLVSVLLLHGAEINKQDIWGWTPLCYAATQDNVSLVNVLLSNGGNPGISTHLGDTPISIALTKDLTNIAHIIEETCPEQSISSSGTVYFGDLELFLAGLQLGHLSTLFQSHQIKLSTLLSMTEQDLEFIGITQVGVRKKLLDAIVDIHKTQWKMPNDPLVIKRALSLQEYSQVISQLTCHINYLTSSTDFIINHTSNNVPSPVAMAIEPNEQQELVDQIQSVVTSCVKFHDEVKKMEKQVYSELRKPIPHQLHYSRGAIMKIFGMTLFFSSSIILFVYTFHKRNMFESFRYLLSNLINSSFKLK